MPPNSIRSSLRGRTLTSTALRLGVQQRAGFHATSRQDLTLREAVAKDHASLKRCCDEYRAATDEDGKRKWGNEILWEMSRHAFGEELVVFPAMQKHLGEQGRAWVTSDLQDTQHLKESLAAFDTLSLSNPHRDTLLSALWTDFAAHARKEEDDQLSKLDPLLGEEESERLARVFERTKGFVGTRPHPESPNEVPWATGAAFLAAPFDRVRDVFRSWPVKEGEGDGEGKGEGKGV